MFDNAIKASANSADKLINLDITWDNASLLVTMKNTIDSSVLKINPELRSDNNDTKSHGYGTKIIREIAAKYNGFTDFYEENNMFCCNIILYP